MKKTYLILPLATILLLLGLGLGQVAKAACDGDCKATAAECDPNGVHTSNGSECGGISTPFCCNAATATPPPDDGTPATPPSTPPTTPPGGGSTGPTSVDLKPYSPIGDISVQTLIGYIIAGLLGVIGSIALIIFIYGGFLLLISQGDAAKIKKGKDVMIWASIGLIVIFGSYIFVAYIINGLTGGTATVGGGGTTSSGSCRAVVAGTPCTPASGAPCPEGLTRCAN